jgi:signal transduction histidine kinase
MNMSNFLRTFFLPATLLMSRLNYTRKFLLLALVSLAAFGVMAYGLHEAFDKDIKLAQLNLKGIAQTKPIPMAIQAIQNRRGRRAAFLNNHMGMGDDYEEVDRKADSAFKALEENLPPGMRKREDWQNIRTNWERLRKEEPGMAAADNFAAHSRVIEQLLSFGGVIADEYALTDPQIDTYYLIDTTINKLPDMLEHIGQLRAYGVSILGSKQLTDQQKIRLYKIIGVIDDALAALEISFRKTGQHNRAIQGKLSSSSREIADSVRQVVGIVEADLLDKRFATPPEDYYEKTTLAINNSYLQMYESLLPTTGALLKERIARAENTLYASVGVAMLLLMIVTYFVIGIYYSIVDNVRSLAHSARAIANGNLDARISLGTRDELGQIGDSFNEMADGFNAMLAAREQAEEALRQSHTELKDAQDHLMQADKMSSIGQLAAGVAHEINNPIGYVYSNLGTLEKYVQDAFGMIGQYEQAEGAIADEAVRARLRAAREKLDIRFLKDDLRALMNESKDGITRVKKIVQSLKDFSHVDVSEEWHFADLHNGLDSTLNIVHNEIKYKANVVREYGDIPEVECLSSQLNQVFMNLLVNAAHAIEERGTITVRTGQQGDGVWVEVADTGKGIAPEHLKKIFIPFFTTKPVGKGTGLGLSLSYGIIQKHHGRIKVESEPGKGTTFRVWLPVKQPQGEQA